MVDVGFTEFDEVVFTAGALQSVINLRADRTAAAVTFAGPFVLEGHTLGLRSGNVTVNDGITAVMRSNIAAESTEHSIRKLGGGTCD